MAQTLARAELLAPGFATYPFKRGVALLFLAETTTDHAVRLRASEQAVAALRRCVAIDPAFADCHHLLAETLHAGNRLQAALEHYDRAIRADPTVARFYPPYADALVALKEYDAAHRVVSEGLRVLPLTDQSRPHVYSLHVLAARVHQARGERTSMLQALQTALAMEAEVRPELLFELGTTYARATPADPRWRELLGRFWVLVCRGSAAAKYADQCEIVQARLMKPSR